MSVTSMNADADPLDPRRFRTVIGAFATGVAVITTEADGEYHGVTVNSLTSVSLDPCMLLICLRLGSTTGHAIRKRGEFTVNILAAHQRDLLHRFVHAKAVDRFADLDVEFSPGGMPLLSGAIAHICCRVAAIHPGGDHDIIVGQVLSCRDRDGHPLVFHKGTFGAFRIDS